MKEEPEVACLSGAGHPRASQLHQSRWLLGLLV